MQLKGLVRFFTILLIVFSIYELSFTWIVRNHENKMAAKAEKYVKSIYPDARKYASVKDMPDSLKNVYEERLKKLLDSTSGVTVSYGVNGPISYQKAKQEELNLGLDLQGGMSVTLEVEMTGLVRTLANNSTDPNFVKALDNAERRKANSDANFVTLFVNEYQALVGKDRLAALFYATNQKDLSLRSTDAQVASFLQKKADEAFENTGTVLKKRIDKFGVAQPGINLEKDRGIITVELPGIQDREQDRERVRATLQSSANLQFWETYPMNNDMAARWTEAIADYNRSLGAQPHDSAANKPVVKESAINGQASNGNAPRDSNDLAGQLDDANKQQQNQQATTAEGTSGRSFESLVKPSGGYSLGIVKIYDTAAVRSMLNSDLIRKHLPADIQFAYGAPEPNAGPNGSVVLYGLKTGGATKAPIEGDQIKDAFQDFEQASANPIVTLSMYDEGSRKWATMTENSQKNQIPLAIVLDGVVQSAPIASERIEGGGTRITGNFSIEQAQDLANVLKSGRVSAPAKIVQDEIIGPTLGSAAIRGGMTAFVVSFIVIFLLMLVYYNSAGWIANIALILNLLFTVGVLTSLGATLTAPGIAGLVLTVGMAVDTNVIIYERIKEELDRGKGYIPAINEGYRRSLPPVLDGHFTILLTAVILYSFGLGPVKGFATTQIIGILLSLFCGILVSRWVSDMFTNRKRHLNYFTGISRKIFKHAKFKFIEYRKIAYAISFAVLALGIGSLFNGFDYGVEFDGGRSYTVNFRKDVNVETVRKDLQEVFDGKSPVIKTVGNNQTLEITTDYKIDETNQVVYDSVVQATLLKGLAKYLPQGLGYKEFDRDYKIHSRKVLATISDDLKRGAIKATIVALIVIFLYIFLRFRDWRYSLGTIVALLHDVLVTLIVFSFARKLVNFPLEIDQHFIAAVLTVIGFSMNDTVIVFDRIREDRRLYPSAPLGETINRAINETLSRTIMTSLTVFLTILILFLVGGEVTRGFAFAMLVGVITGTYSSIFVAAPILVDLGGKHNKKKDKPDASKKA